MTIRRARAEEAAELSSLALAAKAYWKYPAELLASPDWRAQLSISAERVLSMPVYVHVVDQRVVGFYALERGWPQWKLQDLWVHPDWIRKGIGRSLLMHASGIAARSGVHELTIDAEPHAEPFYLALGARRVGAVPAPLPGEPDRIRPQLVVETR